MLFKKQNNGTDGAFFHGKHWNKVLLGFYCIEYAKIKYGQDFNLFKMLK